MNFMDFSESCDDIILRNNDPHTFVVLQESCANVLYGNYQYNDLISFDLKSTVFCVHQDMFKLFPQISNHSKSVQFYLNQLNFNNQKTFSYFNKNIKELQSTDLKLYLYEFMLLQTFEDAFTLKLKRPQFVLFLTEDSDLIYQNAMQQIKTPAFEKQKKILQLTDTPLQNIKIQNFEFKSKAKYQEMIEMGSWDTVYELSSTDKAIDLNTVNHSKLRKEIHEIQQELGQENQIERTPILAISITLFLKFTGLYLSMNQNSAQRIFAIYGQNNCYLVQMRRQPAIFSIEELEKCFYVLSVFKPSNKKAIAHDIKVLQEVYNLSVKNSQKQLLVLIQNDDNDYAKQLQEKFNNLQKQGIITSIIFDKTQIYEGYKYFDAVWRCIEHKIDKPFDTAMALKKKLHLDVTGALSYKDCNQFVKALSAIQ